MATMKSQSRAAQYADKIGIFEINANLNGYTQEGNASVNINGNVAVGSEHVARFDKSAGGELYITVSTSKESLYGDYEAMAAVVTDYVAEIETQAANL